MSSYGLQPKIAGAIGQQNYEKIRERIVEVLGAELDNQYILNPSVKELDVDVWMERVIPFEESELKPAVVNVLFDNGEFDNNSRVMTDGTYTYFIEIYSKAPSSDSQDGDELARTRSTRLAGIVRQILMSTQYSALGFEPGVIRNRQVQNILSYRFNEEDTTRVAVTRITFTVISNEAELTSAIVPLGGTDTAVRINCTDKGYVWSREGSYNPDQPYPPCDCEFQVILFNSNEKPLYTLNENTGDTFELPNVTVVDGNGDSASYPYDPETPIVTTECSVVCADCTVNVNGSLFDTVASGDTLDVPVEYENGTPVGTITGGVVEIPNPITCSPCTYSITDSDGNVLDSGSIASGGSETIVISDSVAVLKDTGGAVLSSTNILAEGSEDIEAPDGTVTVNSAAFDTVLSGGSLDVKVEYEDGTPVGTIVGDIVEIPDVIEDLITKVNFEADADLDFDITIDSDTAGTYTAASFGGSISSATYEVNAVVETLPITVVATDVLSVFPDSDDGFVRLTGTY
jgi:hypothetical protein